MSSWTGGASVCNKDVGTKVGLVLTVRLREMEMRLKTAKSSDFQMGILVFADTGGLAMNTVELLKVILPPKVHKDLS